MTDIICPLCGRRASLPVPDGEAGNDNEHHQALMPPEGFRKVQPGQGMAAIHLYCTSCGVAAPVVAAGDDITPR